MAALPRTQVVQRLVQGLFMNLLRLVCSSGVNMMCSSPKELGWNPTRV